MFDHLSIGVSDFRRSVVFYDEVLATLGYVRLWTAGDAAGYGALGGEEPFAIKQEKERTGAVPSLRTHLAFTAKTRDEVAAFYAAALRNGASDNGEPGLRPQYGKNYFAGFVRDPDGYQLEVVCHR